MWKVSEINAIIIVGQATFNWFLFYKRNSYDVCFSHSFSPPSPFSRYLHLLSLISNSENRPRIDRGRDD